MPRGGAVGLWRISLSCPRVAAANFAGAPAPAAAGAQPLSPSRNALYSRLRNCEDRRSLCHASSEFGGPR
jgi:hypothetical protein